MIKTLEQINREFIEEHIFAETEISPAGASAGETGAEKASGSADPSENITTIQQAGLNKKAIDIVIFAAIVLIFITALVFNTSPDKGFSILGYSGFSFLGGNTQSGISAGSLVLTDGIDPERINAGDDVAFIGADSGAVVPGLGSILLYITENIFVFLLIPLVVIIAGIYALNYRKKLQGVG